MKTKALALALFAAGVFASFALADNGHGKGHGKHGASTSTSSSTESTTAATTTTDKHGKIVICHRAGKSGRWVKVKIAPKAAAKRLKKGDQLPDADGNCPAPAPKHHQPGTTTATTTTATTTESGQ